MVVDCYCILAQVAWKKNFFLGMKRGRLIGGPLNVCIQMGVTVSWPWAFVCKCEVMMFYVFQNVAENSTENENVNVSLQRWLMASFMPLNTLLGITFGMNGALVDIIGEKEKKLKIVQNIYGMSESMYWTTWMTFYGIIAVISLIIIYIFWLAVIPVLTTVNFLISFVILVSAYLQTLLTAAHLNGKWQPTALALLTLFQGCNGNTVNGYLFSAF